MKFVFRGCKVSYPTKSNILACCLVTIAMVKNFSLNYSTFAQLSRDALFIRFCSLYSVYFYPNYFFCSYCFGAIVLLSSCGNAKITNFENLAFVHLFPKVIVCRTALRKSLVVFASYSYFFN